MLKSVHFLVLGTISVAAPNALAVPITTLMRTGDVIPGAGTVVTPEGVAVNNSGEWLASAVTSPSFQLSVVKNGAPYLLFGQTIPPPGATVSNFDFFTINAAGDFGGDIDFQTSATSGTGVYLNTSLVIQTGDISAAPQFSPNTPYLDFDGAKLNDVNEIITLTRVDDPAIPGTVNPALVRMQLGPGGALISETVIAKQGDIPTGFDQTIAGIQNNRAAWAINNLGSAIYVIDGSGSTATDGAVYLDSTLLAREGSPSPIAGRNWVTLNNVRPSLNNNGDYAFSRGVLAGDTGSDQIIIKNGQKFIQEGDTLPAIGGVFTFESLSGLIDIDDAGNVLWLGDWNDPNTSIDRGLFLNDQLLVQEGVTTIGGVVVQEIFDTAGNYQLSDNGQYIAFVAFLEDNSTGAFMIQVPEPGALGLVLTAAPALLYRRRRG